MMFVLFVLIAGVSLTWKIAYERGKRDVVHQLLASLTVDALSEMTVREIEVIESWAKDADAENDLLSRFALEREIRAVAMKMPESLHRHVLNSMEIGEVAFTMPWAMMADEESCLFLNGKYPAQHQPGGTVSMRVERREDGYHVFDPDDEGYTPTVGIPWVGATRRDLIPVQSVN